MQINNFEYIGLSDYKSIHESKSITTIESAHLSSGYDSVSVIKGKSWDSSKNRRQNNISILCSHFKESVISVGIDPQRLHCAIRKLSDFVELMDLDLDIEKDVFEIEDLIEDSISVRFGRRRDMKLNIYYDQDAEDDDSFEEAFLTYKVNGIRYVENNSIQNAVRLIKKLLIR